MLSHGDTRYASERGVSTGVIILKTPGIRLRDIERSAIVCRRGFGTCACKNDTKLKAIGWRDLLCPEEV